MKKIERLILTSETRVRFLEETNSIISDEAYQLSQTTEEKGIF